MKKLLPLLLICTAVVVAKPAHAQKAKWQELDAFHEVMSKTFHPAEEGKLEPIRSRSAEMVEKAIAWKNSTAPEGYDKAAVLENLKKLVKGAKEIDKMVKKNASDKELKEELSELHDVFHQIVEKCEKGEHH
ncbi:MAG TPA: hypothetical protein VK483_10540 [Chitinophagaceae bacterium]|nr:hypothetical protein [Chitinophagaceae bacterium]